MSKLKVETLCPKCRKPLPTKRVTEKRASGTLNYSILDDAQIALVNGRWHHRECK